MARARSNCTIATLSARDMATLLAATLSAAVLSAALLAGCQTVATPDIMNETDDGGGDMNTSGTPDGGDTSTNGDQSTNGDNSTNGDSSTNASNDTVVTIEPDDFADGTELTTINPHVTFSTTVDDNVPIPTFPVTATDDGLNLAPTGSQVFGHANIQFFNNTRRLRMDFTNPVKAVQIQFAGGTFFQTEIGRIQAFDAAGNMIAEDVSAPKASGVAELLTITRSSADIAFAIAYVAAGEGSFGRFDALSFTLAGQ